MSKVDLVEDRHAAQLRLITWETQRARYKLSSGRNRFVNLFSDECQSIFEL